MRIPHRAMFTGANFSQAIYQHQAMVYSIGWHFLRNRTIAEELAQDVFLKLHENWSSMESPSHIANWLRRAMTQRCIDYSRRARLRPKFGLEDAPEPATQPAQSDPLLRNRLEELIASLPERSRAIVVLRYQEELEPAEIAETLGLSIGAVKSSLHRSLVWLRGRLEKPSMRLRLTENQSPGPGVARCLI